MQQVPFGKLRAGSSLYLRYVQDDELMVAQVWTRGRFEKTAACLSAVPIDFAIGVVEMMNCEMRDCDSAPDMAMSGREGNTCFGKF
jgi:hypothetical protein